MKITITRLLETSKALSTEAGQQLKETLVYLAELAEQTVRALRNGLTFADNFDCTVSKVSLKHNTATVVSATKAVAGMVPMRVYSSTYALDSFTWYYDDGNRLNVKAGFVGSPSASVDVTLLILY